MSIQAAAVIITAVTAAAAGVFYSVMSSRKNRERIASEFGVRPDKETDFESIEESWKTLKSFEVTEESTDDATWDDLDMDSVFSAICSCQTSTGEEYLYRILHMPKFSREDFASREHLIDLLDADPALREDLQVLMSAAGKKPFSRLTEYCFTAESERINPRYLYTVLGYLPVLLAALLPFFPVYVFLPLIFSCALNSLLYVVINGRLQQKMYSMHYFSSLLRSAGKILKRLDGTENAVVSGLNDSYKVFRKIGGKLSAVMKEKMTELEVIMNYFRIMMLTDIRSFNFAAECISRNRELFRQFLDSYGELDASAAVLSFRKSLPYLCYPEFADRAQFSFERMYHPLIDNAADNSAVLEKNFLISGSNASGKSTFIKMFGVNILLAQTINTCTAQSFRLKPAFVITSMAVRDSLLKGESYFITEIKSLKRILDKIPQVYCVCLIDEILRGTNTTERIAASYSVLMHINGLDCLCGAATHDIELTKMLSGIYDNFHFAEEITDNEITFDYRIKPGPARTRNAVRLLEVMGFSPDIISEARRIVSETEPVSENQ